jgi:two-component system chemotaxis sensor kinase CheA
MASRAEKNQRPDLSLSVYKKLYLKEARRCLVTLQQNLVRLRDDSADEAALQEAHRAAHTLRGMSATMRYDTQVALAETLEGPLRQADRAKQLLAPEQVIALLIGCDDFEAGLDRLAATDGYEGQSSSPRSDTGWETKDKRHPW